MKMCITLFYGRVTSISNSCANNIEKVILIKYYHTTFKIKHKSFLSSFQISKFLPCGRFVSVERISVRSTQQIDCWPEMNCTGGNYSIGQIEIEQQTPIPSKSRIKPWEKGVGGKFSFYFVQDCCP